MPYSTIEKARSIGAEIIAIPSESLEQFISVFNSSFVCQKCGKCCSGRIGLRRIYLSPDDIRLIVSTSNYSRNGIKKLTTLIKGERYFLTPCPLLSSDNTCLVHVGKPSACISFPFIEEVIIDGEKCPRVSLKCEGIKKLLER